MCISNSRAIRKPSLMRKLLSRYGSLIRPFQPTVVRGFSRSDDDDQTIIGAMQDVVKRNPGARSRFGDLVAATEFPDDVGWRNEFFHFSYAQIVGTGHYFSWSGKG
jgi:hypothetical protein